MTSLALILGVLSLAIFAAVWRDVWTWRRDLREPYSPTIVPEVPWGGVTIQNCTITAKGQGPIISIDDVTRSAHRRGAGAARGYDGEILEDIDIDKLIRLSQEDHDGS